MKNRILSLLLLLTTFGIATAQTLQTVVNNGNTVTTPVRFNGRTDFGESYDAGHYGAVQITRAASQGTKYHLSFIRNGQMIYGMGFLNNSNIFGIQPGSDNNSSNGIFMALNGNVGMGTTNPQSKLHVYQNTADQVGLIVQGNTINNDAAQHYTAITIDGDYGNMTGNYSQIRSYSNLYNSWGSKLAFFTTMSGVANTLTEKMRIESNGNVGIGTTTPSDKLSVNGRIRAHEIKVETANWPDFVFTKDYILPTLQETEKHIKDKGHLPGIPSAAEVEKNGIELGEMNKKLLQKIEELTLYLIEMKKENTAIKKELADQKELILDSKKK